MATLDTFSALVAGLGGSLVAIVALLALDLLKPRRFCPDCRVPLPKIRRHRNQRQGLWGGWTCPQCGCEVDRKGQRILAWQRR
jgi:hypothetical protein